MVGEANRDDRSGDLFGKSKADVRVTRLMRKSRAATALRILFVTRQGFCQRRYLLVEHKDRAVDGADLGRQRSAYVRFDYRHISGTDRPVRIHIFAEIPATDWHAHLRFGQGNIGGINCAISVHITN
jgi:hypothetical protein